MSIGKVQEAIEGTEGNGVVRVEGNKLLVYENMICQGNEITFVVSTSERVKQSDHPIVNAGESTAQLQRKQTGWGLSVFWGDGTRQY